MGTKMKLIAAKARAFLREKRGNVAMIFAISIIPLTLAAGAGLDFARAMLVRQQMAEALDAAALAVGSTAGLDQEHAKTMAQAYFDANYTVDKIAFGSPVVQPFTYTNADGAVTIIVNDAMPTMLMQLAGIISMPVSASSTVVWGQTKLWVGLVLDNSGSMCEPEGQPCLNDPDTNSKIYQLKSATNQMLTSLKGVSATAGDVQVAIVPFNREVDVGIGNVSASWIYWGFWEAEPPNALLNNVTDLQGPNDSCPWSTGTQGYTCQTSGTNGASTTGSITSGGLICPSMDNGKVNTERNVHYYNGCYTSVATGATKQVSSGSFATCSGSGYANCSCSGSGNSKICSTKYYKHTWTPNAHSSWGGCITDRAQDYDIANTLPSGSDTTGFPADNPANPVDSGGVSVSPSYYCMYGNVTPLEYDWTDLATRVNGMQAKGSTNQAIGVAHAWQALTPGNPYAAPSVPPNTARYIILFSDGLNTQDRWWGDGSTEGTTQDGYIDDREKKVCTAAKADGVVIYTVFMDVGGSHGDSAPLKNCASDTSKYYDLTAASQIATAFADITRQITNVRVSH
ncbi:MAG TPA: pilus assembly protein TadG-related protein [Rhizomicrobium sp.]|nr:pilus assembly protein TadG-related protein [Rhizomicrobium sp.]